MDPMFTPVAPGGPKLKINPPAMAPTTATGRSPKTPLVEKFNAPAVHGGRVSYLHPNAIRAGLKSVAICSTIMYDKDRGGLNAHEC